jgi:hypothetical protein
MSLRYNKFLLQVCISISCLTVICCNKNDKGDHTLAAGSYTFDKAGNYGSLRMFTKQGEVKDQGLINLYSIKFSAHISPTTTTFQDTFRIFDEYTAQYILWNSILITRDLVITKMDDHYQFRSKDTAKFLSFNADSLNRVIEKYKRYHISTPVPTSTGGGYMVTTFQYYYASPTADGLVFPFLNVIRFATLTNQGQPYYTYFGGYRINNVFDENFPLSSLNSDTILVESYDVTYKRTSR